MLSFFNTVRCDWTASAWSKQYSSRSKQLFSQDKAQKEKKIGIWSKPHVSSYTEVELWQEIRGRTNSLLLLIRHEPHRKRLLQQFFITAGTSLRSYYLETIKGYTGHPQTRASNNSSVVACVFVASRSCLLSRWLAMNWDIQFPEQLLSNDKSDTYTDTQTDRTDSWSTPLIWAQVPWYTYQVSWRLVQVFKS
jgi:hypothetical protein